MRRALVLSLLALAACGKATPATSSSSSAAGATTSAGPSGTTNSGPSSASGSGSSGTSTSTSASTSGSAGTTGSASTSGPTSTASGSTSTSAASTSATSSSSAGGTTGPTSTGASSTGGTTNAGSTTGAASSGGTTGTTGATCSPACPSGYTCSAGTCVGGSITGLALDVPTYAVSGTVTRNGQAPAATCAFSAPNVKVAFDETSVGYHFELTGPCVAGQPFTFTGQVYPGTYKVSVSGYSGEPYFPTQAIVVAQGLAVQQDITNLALDVPTYTVSGTVTRNGQPPATTCAFSAPNVKVDFDEVSLGYHLQLTGPCVAGQPFTFSGEVYPGTYKVSVSGYSGEPYFPTQPIVVAQALQVGANMSGLAFDVATVDVSGTVTRNGQAPAATCAFSAPNVKVDFDETTLGYHFELTGPCVAGQPFTFSGQVYPGTYKVSVSGYSGEPYFPTQPIVVNPSLSVQNTTTGLALDVQTITVSGTVTRNGQAPAATCAFSAPNVKVDLDEVTLGYHFELTGPCVANAPFTFTGEVYPGTYRVSVSGYSGEPYFPTQPYTTHTALSLQSNTSGLALDVVTLNVSGTVTRNGQAPAATCAFSAPNVKVDFDEVSVGYHFELTGPCVAGQPFTFSGQVYPGTYRVSISGYSGEPYFPTQAYVVDPSVAVFADRSGLAYDVPSIDVSGTVTRNGQPPATTCAFSAPNVKVDFDDADFGYHFELTGPCVANAPFTFSGQVYPGTYQVSVSGYSGEPYFPTAPFVAVRRLQVP